MIITERLQVEIVEGEEDHPDQRAEHRVQQIENGLVHFVNAFADEHATSEAESTIIRFDVAMQLLGSFQNRWHGGLLGERFNARYGPHRRCENCLHRVIDHGPGGCSKCVCKNETDV